MLHFKKSREWGDKIPIGIIYQQKKPVFRESFPHLSDSIDVDGPDKAKVKNLIDNFS